MFYFACFNFGFIYFFPIYLLRSESLYFLLIPKVGDLNMRVPCIVWPMTIDVTCNSQCYNLHV